MIHKKMMTSLVNKQQQTNKIIKKSISLHISTLHAIKKNHLNKKRGLYITYNYLIAFIQPAYNTVVHTKPISTT